MKILSLTCAGIRGVPDGSYAFTDTRSGAPLPVLLVAGKPASGKTSLLEVIAAAKEAIGAYGGLPPDPMRLVRSGAINARVTSTWRLSAAERELAGVDEADHTITWNIGEGARRAEVAPGLRRLFSEFSRTSDRGKLEYFPANRVLMDTQQPLVGRPNPAAEARVRATRARDKYATVIDGMREIVFQDLRSALARGATGAVTRGALDPFKEGVAAMLPDLRLSGFLFDARGKLQFEGPTRESASLDELSDSEQQGVLFALAFRYFGLNDSLVLIDEPELHVGAADRVRFLEALAALGRDNQIIAATGAAELVSAAERGHVIDLSTTAAHRDASAHRCATPPGRAAAEPAPAPDLVESTPIVGAPLESAAPCAVPSYLRPAQVTVTPTIIPASPSAPPSVDDGNETAQLGAFVAGPALPFTPSGDVVGACVPQATTASREGIDDAGPTNVLPAWGEAPPGKRLIRFDPQTGRPLPEPVWVDALPVNRHK